MPDRDLNVNIKDVWKQIKLIYFEYEQENTNVKLRDTEWAADSSQHDDNKPER